jgi:hypothetical protein
MALPLLVCQLPTIGGILGAGSAGHPLLIRSVGSNPGSSLAPIRARLRRGAGNRMRPSTTAVSVPGGSGEIWKIRL